MVDTDIQRSLGRIEATQTAILHTLQKLEEKFLSDTKELEDRLRRLERNFSYLAGTLSIISFMSSLLFQMVIK